MPTLILSSAGLLLESLILFRGFRNRILSKYPLFYAYIFCVLLLDISSYGVYGMSPGTYRNWYWATQIIILLVGYGVILEIVHKALSPYAGADRVAAVFVAGIFGLVFLFVIYKSLVAPNWSPATTYYELERDLRAVQAIVLASILGVIFGYGISIGRNLKGIILGYGLYIGSSIISLALRAYGGTSFHATWRLIQPYAFLVSLCVWATAMWSWQENPVPRMPDRFESDYESFALRTRALLGSLRSYLERTARP